MLRRDPHFPKEREIYFQVFKLFCKDLPRGNTVIGDSGFWLTKDSSMGQVRVWASNDLHIFKSFSTKKNDF